MNKFEVLLMYVYIGIMEKIFQLVFSFFVN